MKDVQTLVGEEWNTAEAPRDHAEKKAENDTESEDEPGKNTGDSIDMSHDVGLEVLGGLRRMRRLDHSHIDNQLIPHFFSTLSAQELV